MSLYQRNRIWWTKFEVDGFVHRFTTGSTNKNKAQTIENKLKAEVNDQRFGIVKTDPHLTFGEATARFVSSASVRPHHLYHLAILLPFLGDVPVQRLSKSMAEEFRHARRAHNPSIKDATINRDLSVARHVLYWCVDEQIIATNPFARLRMARERSTRRHVLSVTEEHSLLLASTGHLKDMIVIALDTGLRRGEITSQRWEDVDFTRELLFVTRSKTPEGESREIPLTQRLEKLLREHRKDKGLIIDFRGRGIRIVKSAWKTALKNAKIHRIRFHDLRHAFATRLLEAGVMQEVRMALMGHSAGSVHGRYLHVELPAKREAIRKLEQWVTKQQQLSEQQEEKHANSEDD